MAAGGTGQIYDEIGTGYPARRGPAVPARSFDVVMAVLTVHHWTDRDAGTRGLRRIATGHTLAVEPPA